VRACATGGDERPIAVERLTGRSAILPPVENVLLLGQILVSFALMASILLQSRGAGLGATFGGDSSVYRSRRGIEKRLFQFTIVLAVLFVIFSIIAFKLGDANVVTQ
jgi:preprotein translocase subunit SecG